MENDHLYRSLLFLYRRFIGNTHRIYFSESISGEKRNARPAYHLYSDRKCSCQFAIAHFTETHPVCNPTLSIYNKNTKEKDNICCRICRSDNNSHAAQLWHIEFCIHCVGLPSLPLPAPTARSAFHDNRKSAVTYPGHTLLLIHRYL